MTDFKARLRELAEEYTAPYYAGRLGNFIFDWCDGPIPGERRGRTYDYSKILDNLPEVGDPEMTDQQLIDLLDGKVVVIKFPSGSRRRTKKLGIKLGRKRPPEGEPPEPQTVGGFSGLSGSLTGRGADLHEP